ncbi:hypothetical protein L210DRAFT_3541495 [Boletus edulis BED1]|uniref:Fungal-type protein kinase domain-containing protein n=1 Tax=Boletus edulis BED1 TaxID=1328754 RepID=A0AAD4GEL1_BOLED|nr:hypothetical protein L210DRAFT_3541495 [Boletus edulis BED1]
MNPTSWPSSTAIIHEHLNPPKKETRVILFEELMEITKLVGDPFLKCWWDTVLCHRAVSMNGVQHHDITPSNLMYKMDGDRIRGVLIDFDLANR